MPMGEYKDWDECISKNKDKEDPEAYCGSIKHKVEDTVIPPPECLMKAYNHYTQKFPNASMREILDKSFAYFKSKNTTDFIEEQSLDFLLEEIAYGYDLAVQDFLTTDQLPGSRIPEGNTRLQRLKKASIEYEKSYQTPEAQALRESLGGTLRPPLESVTVPFTMRNSETGTVIRGSVIENLQRNTKQLTPVSSSNVKAAGQFGEELLAQFYGDEKDPQRTYRFQFESPEMAEEAYRSLMNSGSPGRWIWENIRGHRAGEEVTSNKVAPSLKPPNKGLPTIGGTTASLVPYSISNRTPISRAERFEAMSKQLQRETSNPTQDPNTGSRIEGLLEARRQSRDKGVKQQKVSEQVRQLPKLDFKVVELNASDMELTTDSFDDLKEWVKRKGLAKDEEEIEQIAFAIINSRKKKGKDKGKENDWEESWKEVGQSFDKQRIVRIKKKLFNIYQQLNPSGDIGGIDKEVLRKKAIKELNLTSEEFDKLILSIRKKQQAVEQYGRNKHYIHLRQDFNDLTEDYPVRGYYRMIAGKRIWVRKHTRGEGTSIIDKSRMRPLMEYEKKRNYTRRLTEQFFGKEKYSQEIHMRDKIDYIGRQFHERIYIADNVNYSANDLRIASANRALKSLPTAFQFQATVCFYNNITDDPLSESDPNDIPKPYRAVGWDTKNKDISAEISYKHKRIRIKANGWNSETSIYHEVSHAVHHFLLDWYEYERFRQIYEMKQYEMGLKRYELELKGEKYEAKVMQYQINDVGEFFACQGEYYYDKQYDKMFPETKEFFDIITDKWGGMNKI